MSQDDAHYQNHWNALAGVLQLVHKPTNNKSIKNQPIHCTIGYAMKIKKKKMFKSKHLVFAHFSTKTGDFFGIDGKIPMFCHKYFLKSKM